MILVTGASGFVGSALCGSLCSRGLPVRGVARTLRSFVPAYGVESVVIGNLDAETDWTSAMAGVDCVIHCAAQAHMMHETEADALAKYRLVNVDGSQHLAEQAAAAGVRRLVYLSSIKVNGEQTALGTPFLFSDAPAPEDSYSISKWEAEQALWAVAANTDLEVVVVRPPLVYGPGIKGNLAYLLNLVRLGVPLPLGMVRNQRSLIGLENLVDLLIRCINHPMAAGQTLLASDGEDVSTPDLIRQMAVALRRSANLLPVPVKLLCLAGRLLGKDAEIFRLVNSLQIESQPTRELLGWCPPVPMAEEIRRMVETK